MALKQKLADLTKEKTKVVCSARVCTLESFRYKTNALCCSSSLIHLLTPPIPLSHTHLPTLHPPLSISQVETSLESAMTQQKRDTERIKALENDLAEANNTIAAMKKQLMVVIVVIVMMIVHDDSSLDKTV